MSNYFRMLGILFATTGMSAGVFTSLCLAQEELRLVHHIPPPRTIFDTWIYISNGSEADQEFQLAGFLRDGQPLEISSGNVAAGEVLRLKSTDLFANPTPSHFFVRGEVRVSLQYTSPFAETYDLYVPEHEVVGDRFRLFCQDWEGQFVGIAAVNLGDDAALISVRRAGFDGVAREAAVWSETVPVLAKAVFSLDQLLLQAVDPPCTIDIESSQPLGLQILRGDLPIRDGARMEALLPTVLRSRTPLADPWNDQP